MKITNCRLCSGTLSEPKLKFPDTPLANEFVKTEESQDLFPLQVCVCNDCGHFQLNESVDRERLFRNNYPFVTGTSANNVEYFKNYAQELILKCNLKPGDLVIDIASSDGTFLQHFKDLGMKVLGIEPATNIAKIANDNGIETISEFFHLELSEVIVRKYGQPKLVTANNVIAHLPYVKNFVLGVKNLIKNEGTFVFEVSYFLDVCEKLLVDTIYLEHESYYCVHPFVNFFTNLDMTLYDVQRTSPHGGSLRGFVSGYCKGVYNNVSDLMKLEREAEIQWVNQDKIDKKMSSIIDRINILKLNISNILKQIKENEKTICIYGFPAKATTLAYLLGLKKEDFMFACDDNNLKIDKMSPGLHIPIVGSEKLYEQKPDYCLILAWNFYQDICNKHQKFLDNGGTFLIPLPEFKIIK